jgi:hypothetical protein
MINSRKERQLVIIRNRQMVYISRHRQIISVDGTDSWLLSGTDRG